MLRIIFQFQIITHAFLSVASEASAERPRLRGTACNQAVDDSSDEVHLLQRFIAQKVDPQRGNITLVTASKTVQLSTDGQLAASALSALTRVQWPANGLAWTGSSVFAVQDKGITVLIVGLSMSAVLLLVYFRVLRQNRRLEAVELLEVGEAGMSQANVQQQPKPLGEMTQWNWDDANWQGCWEEAMLRKQTQGVPSALPDLPAPVPRLRSVGASYVVPFGCIKAAAGTTLSFDIPTFPAVWPLRAVLTRATPQSAWTQIDLTVDIMEAAELPPLLSCTVCSPAGEAHQWCSETTGGTGGTTTPSGQSDKDIVPCSQWLAIRNSGGAILASIMPKEKDPTECVVQRHGQDRVPWEIDLRVLAEEPWVVASRLGQEIGQATSLGCASSQPPSGEDSDASDSEEEMRQHLQIDTQPETQTPESLLLLMCLLAMVSFQPAQVQEGGPDTSELGAV